MIWMEPFEFESPLPPAAVLAALAARAAEWRESRLPAALRASHALGVGVRASGTRFRLWAKYARPDLLTPVCEGAVAGAPGGGSVVRGRAGVPAARWAAFPAFLTIPGLVAFAAAGGRDVGALAFASAGAALGAGTGALARAAFARRIARETAGLRELVRAAAAAGAGAPAA